jgi:hypothetical protein
MSRQNKVNPGMYTQRGRLAQDDAARELRKQRVIGSEHTWQPVQRDARPRVESTTESGDDDVETAEPEASAPEKQVHMTAKAKTPRVTAAAKPAAKAKTATAKAKTTKSTRPAAKAKTASRAKAPQTKRKAVLARGAGKGSALLSASKKKK